MILAPLQESVGIPTFCVTVVQEPGAHQPLTYDLCRAYNEGITRDNGDLGVGNET